ncbi:MAG TPA: RHS repeat domain-containing protein, partial [Chloroflexota bacterium]|nr:RHS repeat domain-containing protein [Chloroflexota bacterium]
METGSGGANWVVQQTVDYDPFATGQLYRQTTKNGSGATTEEHVLSYDDPATSKYVGHRTQDAFTLQSPTNTVCASTCTATYTYDPRGRLVATQDGHGGSTAYTLDPQGNVTRESVTLGGSTTTRNFTYSHAPNELLTPSNQLEKKETHHNGADTSASLLRTKAYALDAFGRPTTLDNDSASPTSDDPDGR